MRLTQLAEPVVASVLLLLLSPLCLSGLRRTRCYRTYAARRILYALSSVHERESELWGRTSQHGEMRATGGDAVDGSSGKQQRSTLCASSQTVRCTHSSASLCGPFAVSDSLKERQEERGELVRPQPHSEPLVCTASVYASPHDTCATPAVRPATDLR
jgi:hypothetical protein